MIALFALLAGAGVALLVRAGDAACEAAVRYYRPYPETPYELRFAPCEQGGWGNAWEVAALP